MTAWGTWSRLPVRRRYDIGVSVIEFHELDAREYQLEINGLRSAGALTDLALQLSADGITWDETPANYITGGVAALSPTGGFPLVASFGTDFWYAGVFEIDNFDLATPSWMHNRGGRLASSTGMRYVSVMNSQAVVWKAMRIKAISGITFSHNLGCLLREKRPYA